MYETIFHRLIFYRTVFYRTCCFLKPLCTTVWYSFYVAILLNSKKNMYLCFCLFAHWYVRPYVSCLFVICFFFISCFRCFFLVIFIFNINCIEFLQFSTAFCRNVNKLFFLFSFCISRNKLLYFSFINTYIFRPLFVVASNIIVFFICCTFKRLFVVQLLSLLLPLLCIC